MTDPKHISDYVGSAIDSMHQYRKPDLYKTIPPQLILDREFTRELIKQCFWRNDPDISPETFVWLPEYEKLINWAANTQGKGLLLMGNPGTGKSIILKWFVPTVMKMIEKIVYPISCYDLHKIHNPDESKETYFDKARKRRYILLDEVGVEMMVAAEKVYTEKFNPVERLINLSEDENKALFMTTNLKEEEIITKYGLRSYDRLIKKTAIIKFTSTSLRK